MSQRLAFLDHLRVAACFMVMAVHACEPFYLGGEPPDVTALASRGDLFWVTVTECLCRACVPLFVLASSYLLFPLRVPAATFFRRRFVRVVVPFAIWAALYVGLSGAGSGWGRLAFNFPDEGGHLWFVPMLIGLYLLMPLLSPWAEKVEARELKGWLLLWFVTTTFPYLRRLWSCLYGAPSFGAVPYLWGECPWNAFGAFHYVSGFFGYLLLGLWFRRFAPALDWRRTLRLAVPVGAVGMLLIGLPFFLSVRTFPFAAPYAKAVRMEMSIEYCSTGVALTTVAAFLVFRRLGAEGGWLHRTVVQPIAEASYGMYLLHMLILTPMFAFLRPHLPTPLTIVGTAAATFVLSALAAILIRRVPVVGRWVCG